VEVVALAAIHQLRHRPLADLAPGDVIVIAGDLDPAGGHDLDADVVAIAGDADVRAATLEGQLGTIASERQRAVRAFKLGLGPVFTLPGTAIPY
jgi:hypothetical protein